MEIKPFHFKDNESIIELLSNCSPYVVPHHPYVYWIMSQYFPSLNLAAWEDGKIVGFVCALHSIEKDNVFVWQLAIDHAYRQTGVALKLCDKIIQYAEDHKVSSLQLTISDQNAASLSFFTKLAAQKGKQIEKIEMDGLEVFENESAYEIKL